MTAGMDQEIVDTYAVDIENFHHVARGILMRLYTRSAAAYAELKPHELTGNAFNYHLRHVVAQGLVMQDGEGSYRLSATGRLLMDSVSLESMRLKLRPVAGLMILVRAPNGHVLAYESKREPLRGTVGLPFGKLRLGDSLDATVTRVLAKRGIARDETRNLRPVGTANIRYLEHGQLVSHRMVSVWEVDYAGSGGQSVTQHGFGKWIDPAAPGDDVLPEVTVISSWREEHVLIEISRDLAG